MTNPYVEKGEKRIFLHSLVYGGAVALTSYLMWWKGLHHYLLIPGALGVLAAFGKELIEQLPPPLGVRQVWAEFWVDSFAQAGGSLVGVWAMWVASH